MGQVISVRLANRVCSVFSEVITLNPYIFYVKSSLEVLGWSLFAARFCRFANKAENILLLHWKILVQDHNCHHVFLLLNNQPIEVVLHSYHRQLLAETSSAHRNQAQKTFWHQFGAFFFLICISHTLSSTFWHALRKKEFEFLQRQCLCMGPKFISGAQSPSPQQERGDLMD